MKEQSKNGPVESSKPHKSKFWWCCQYMNRVLQSHRASASKDMTWFIDFDLSEACFLAFNPGSGDFELPFSLVWTLSTRTPQARLFGSQGYYPLAHLGFTGQGFGHSGLGVKSLAHKSRTSSICLQFSVPLECLQNQLPIKSATSTASFCCTKITTLLSQTNTY